MCLMFCCALVCAGALLCAVMEENDAVLKELYLLGTDLKKPCNEAGDLPAELAKAEGKDEIAGLPIFLPPLRCF